MQEDQKFMQVWKAFLDEGFQTRIVGGAVRDFIFGVKIKDTDFCTTATPDQMVQLAEKYGFRIEPTGLQHGTVSFIVEGVAYEFTTLRVDTDCDGRHASVQFTTDFKADAARRDFTMNAMSMDINGVTYDYFGGVQDMRDRVLRFVGDPTQRIQEDYLRILRFFRFMDRYNLSADQDTLKAIEQNAQGLTQISRERIWSEISRTFNNSTWKTDTLNTMVSTGVTSVIGMSPNWRGPIFADKAITAPSLMAGWLAFPSWEEGQKWKMSNDEIREMIFVYESWEAFFSDNPGREIAKMYLEGADPELLRIAGVAYGMGDIVGEVISINYPKFPVTGNDLLAQGFSGKELGDQLKRLKSEWIEQTLNSYCQYRA